MKLRNLIFTFIFASLFIQNSLLSHKLWAEDGFDEIHNEDQAVHPLYLESYEAWLKMSDKDKSRYLKKSKKAFKGDNQLEAMPRILSGNEYDEILKKGIEQRAEALIAFLNDHYSGERSYIAAGIIPEKTVQTIIKRSGDQLYDQLLRQQKMSFVYGPDIIRDSDGNWRIIEDNIGFVGGLGDLVLAQKFYFENFQQTTENYSYRDAEKFYDEIARLYKKRAKAMGGEVILYMTPPYEDNEDKRLSRLLLKRGIKTVTPYTNEELSVEADGVYTIHNKTRIKTKLGLIILIGEHWWLDAHYEANQPRSNEFRKKNKKDFKLHLKQAQHARGLTDAILQNKVATNYTPGIDFVGDKEFYLYVEDLIRFYLNEEPIVKSLQTASFAHKQTGKLRKKFLKHVMNNFSQYVVKTVDGRGGDGVWVGPKVEKSQLKIIAKKIKESPSSYIVQKYTPLSTLNDLIVDLRVLTIVSDNKVYVSDSPWGRGLPATGDGKVNLSANGREITVLVADKKSSKCKKLISE